jgi:hypothetical protein
VICRDARNLFMPDKSDWGLRKERTQQVLIVEDLGCSNVYLRCSGSCNGWLAFKDDNAIGEICCHDEIVLDNEGGLLRV